MQIASAALLALGVAATAYVISIIQTSLRHRAQAKAWGCQPGTWRPAPEPFGVVYFFDLYKAYKEKRCQDFFIERQDKLNRDKGRILKTVLQRSLFRSVISTSDPRNFQAILATQFNDFGLGVGRTDNFAPLLGKGIFATNGDNWRHARALLRPQFIRSQIADMDMVESHVQVLLEALRLRQGQDNWTGVVDVLPLFYRLTIDTATEFLCGKSLETQRLHINGSSADSDKNLAFVRSFDRAQYFLSLGISLGHRYSWAHTAEFERHVAHIKAFLSPFIQSALEYRAANPKDYDPDPSKGEKYVFLHALAQDTQDPEEMRAAVLNILLAGRDTTAVLLSWFFTIMGARENAQCYRKLRAVIHEDFGTRSEPKEVTFESLKSCRYLQWCIRETLRLYPPVPSNVRTAQVDTTLPYGGGPDGESPLYVPKGKDIYLPYCVMHRHADIWGDDAKEFRPERWGDLKQGWSFLAFNGGPRVCLGQQFALTEAAHVIVRLVQNIKEMDGSELSPHRMNLTLTNSPADGVKLRLHFDE